MAQIGLGKPALARLDPIIAQKFLCDTGNMRFLVKIFLRECAAGEDHQGAETHLIDEI
jgi:hypothetical protein